MKPVKHDAIYNEAMERADKDFHSEDGLGMVGKCPYIFSSNMADAYWITAHVLYYCGRRPSALHKSTGYKWIVDIKGNGTYTATVDKADHRTGIKGIVNSHC
jgi:hypothetical protein